MFTSLLIYLIFGAFSGLVAGLFGVGGGAVIVPILIYSFTMQNFSADVLTHMAVGTSLAVICFTSVSSIKTHHQNGFVLWPYVKIMAPALLLGVAIGVTTVVQIPGVLLQWIIGAFLCLISCKMAFDLAPKAPVQNKTPSTLALASAGGFIGWVSALFGIGGGTLTVPFLNHYGVRIQQAIATSAACGFPIALGGGISNIVAGLHHANTPEYSLGFIYLPALLGLAVMSMPFAKLGATLAKRLPAKHLKLSFAVFLFIVGSSIIAKASGIFSL